MNQAQRYFSSLVKLAQDSGLIGQILRRYPAEILRAADKWADQTATYERKHQDPRRLPLPDPWQFLLDAPAVPERDKAVFRAAQSQLPALRHVIHIAEGIATLNTDWYQEAINARDRGDEAGFNHAVSKVADGHVIHAPVQEHARRQMNPQLSKQMERLSERRRAQLIHRGEGNKVRHLRQWPSWIEFRERNGLAVVLVEWWARCGADGAPGLMFWRNEALTKFLKFHLDQSNLDPQGVKKVRQQLGLRPVGKKDHLVWDVSIKLNGQGRREIKGYRRNGKQRFSGLIHSQKRISSAVLLSAK